MGKPNGTKMVAMFCPSDTSHVSRTPMPLSEVLPAIQRGILDGAKSGIVNFVAFKFQHIAKYVTRTSESLICVPTLASKGCFDRLSAADRAMIVDEAMTNGSVMQPRSEKFNANNYNVLKKIGGELIDLSPAEKPSSTSVCFRWGCGYAGQARGPPDVRADEAGRGPHPGQIGWRSQGESRSAAIDAQSSISRSAVLRTLP